MTTPGSLSMIQSVLDQGLVEYRRRTHRDLSTHPLTAQLADCESPEAILAVFQEQLQGFSRFRDRSGGSLRATVHMLHNLSGTMAFPPANAIFAGIGVLLHASVVNDKHDLLLIEVFERLQYFFNRLNDYTRIPPSTAMTEILAKIMAEVLHILAILTNEVKQGRFKRYTRLLLHGTSDLDEAIMRLDILTREEAQITTTHILTVVYGLMRSSEMMREDSRIANENILMAVEGMTGITRGSAYHVVLAGFWPLKLLPNQRQARF
ncbi:hypothetical protein F5148DRAFT_1230964 [Russula earlei]|uniref:Uncharacterized protein n=1 Tax=Russula earlei TaxID=71964 RepID=A0ACC0TZX2_9AGAM|nr:hypothetical protein F5148DRAFT_1230964 [Russula earlei]